VAPGQGLWHAPQGLGVERKLAQVHHRVAHLAGQRDAQVAARELATLHQQLAQRHAALGLLPLQRIGQLLRRHQPQRGQRLADAHHGHARLFFQRHEQLFGLDDLLDDEVVAQLAVAQVVLLAGGELHLLRRHGLLRHQHAAYRFAHLKVGVGVARQELWLDVVAFVDRREQEQSVLGFDVAHRFALAGAAVAQREAVGQPGPVRQQLRMGEIGWPVVPVRSPVVG